MYNLLTDYSYDAGNLMYNLPTDYSYEKVTIVQIPDPACGLHAWCSSNEDVAPLCQTVHLVTHMLQVIH